MPEHRVARALATASLLLSHALAAQAPPAGDARAPLDTVRFVAREGTRLAVDVAPDGRELVIDLLGQLWTLPLAGGEARPLTDAVRDTAADADPAFSPDGRRIAFRADRPGGRGLFVVDRGTRLVRRVTEPLGGWEEARGHAWSPDGRRLLYVLRDTLRLLDLGAGVVRPLLVAGLPSPGVRDPAWSADGTRILFVNATASSRGGGRLWEVPAEGGAARAAGGDAPVLLPAPSPDGACLAWLARDTLGRLQLWVRDGAGAARRLTDRADLAPSRARWLPGGRELLVAADGRLWRVPAMGGAAREVPFAAPVRIAQRRAALQPVRLAWSDSISFARGFMGLALAPDGRTLALLALGKLWVVPVDGGRPRDVREVPATAAGLSWSPDGARVAWSAGRGGAEDLFVTDVRDGGTRRLTALPGREERASWSPDGRWIAFLHWAGVPRDSAPWTHDGWRIRLRVVPAADARGTPPAPVARVEDTRDLGAVAGYDWTFGGVGALGAEVPQWSPRGDALLEFGAADSTASLVALDGTRRAVPRFPRGASFVQWGDSTLVFVRENRLWRTRFSAAAGAEGEPDLLDDPALHATRARDGSVAYLSSDGIRLWRPNLWRPDGRVMHVGWPLAFRATPAPPPLLVRNARVVPGTGAAPTGLSDLLVVAGTIARLAPAGTIRAPQARVVDAGGRTVLPGLVELHGHLWDDATLFGALAAGITTFRDMGSAAARTAGFRDAILYGAMEGPRLVLGGFQFDPAATDGLATGAVLQAPGTAAGIARGLALARALGADFAKMRAPQGVAAALALVEQAHARGMRVASHCALALPLVAAGIDGQEHVGPACDERYEGRLYGDVAALLRAAGESVVPTIAGYAVVPWLAADSARLAAADPSSFVTPWLRWWMLRLPPRSAAAYARFADDARRATRALHDAGVTLGAGSDVAAPRLALHLELEQLVAAGLSPLEAITAATGTAARILGTRDVGELRPGALADFVIVDGDPLADIRDTRRIWRVILGGREVDRARLATVAQATAEGPGR